MPDEPVLTREQTIVADLRRGCTSREVRENCLQEFGKPAPSHDLIARLRREHGLPGHAGNSPVKLTQAERHEHTKMLIALVGKGMTQFDVNTRLKEKFGIGVGHGRFVKVRQHHIEKKAKRADVVLPAPEPKVWSISREVREITNYMRKTGAQCITILSDGTYTEQRKAS